MQDQDALNPEKENTEPVPDQVNEEGSKPPVHNPFDKNDQPLTKEEEENLELFKEAQTERD